MSKVMIHPATYEDACQAVDRAFELFPMELKGKSILLKPNVLREAKAEEGITTHPAVLRAVVEKIETMQPAAIVVGDNPGVLNYGKNEDCFAKTGLMEAAAGYYQNIGDNSLCVDFNPDFKPTLSLSRIVLDADIIISLPKFKTHGLTVMSGAVKNSYGFLPGAQKANLHKLAGSPKRFHEMLIDVFRLRIPDLFIVDAVVGMEGNGPASSDLRNIGLILASDNAVAMDSVITAMMGCEPGQLRFLQKAKEAGLGDYDLNSIEVIGELKQIPNFKLPPLSGEMVFNNPPLQSFLQDLTLLRPQTDPELCTGCGTCVDQCPALALSMNADLPQVDADTCITCFCCQEICPEKAITLQ